MKKAISLILIITMLFTTMCIGVSAKGVDDVAYRVYVSVNGNDSTGNGTAAKPFATIENAKEYVRTLDKTSGDIVVEIGEGTYKITKAIVFDENDSGSDVCPTAITSATRQASRALFIKYSLCSGSFSSSMKPASAV
ncbi:MAG: hypothetical protein IKY78_00685 [Clostridia bacterium]|nr:hypothetical protein [Clostridia bacterium]